MTTDRMNRTDRWRALESLFRERVALLDGAMGTCLQDLNLTPTDFGGDGADGCNESLNLHCPQVIASIHAAYLEAGSDIVETNTFGSTPLVLAEYGLGAMSEEISRQGAVIARAEANRFSTNDRLRFVAGAMGPTNCALSIDRKLSFQSLALDHYLPQARGLYDGGVDYFLLETCQDVLNLKAALWAIQTLFEAENRSKIPVAISATVDGSGHMLAGMTVEALAETLAPFDLLYLGLNCGEGPVALSEQAKLLGKFTHAPVALMPNAGLPDENGRYDVSSQNFADQLLSLCGDGVLNLVGGCCGTTPDHIRALSRVLSKMTPRPLTSGRNVPHSCLTGIDVVRMGQSQPVIAGEKSNALGSKKFRELLRANDFDGAADFAKRQLNEGAKLLDVAVQQTDRCEIEDMTALLEKLVPRTKAPIMVDSTSPEVAAAALQRIQGKAIVNSTNLEGGEAKFRQMARVARRFGAALVVGLIDESGMAITRERKLAIAQRALRLLREENMPLEDIYFDALVFPCASGDPTYLGAAQETVEGIRCLKQTFPNARTILGISNVSFGLPPGIRPLVTRLFFDACSQEGLDLAIANAAGLQNAHSALENGEFSPELMEAATCLLAVQRPANFPPTDDAVQNWQALITRAAELGRAAQKTPTAPSATASPKDILESPQKVVSQCVIRGTRDGLSEAIRACIDSGMSPSAVLDGPLMAGMDEVGRQFDLGNLIVPEVLSSAEVMKAAIDVLSPLLTEEKSSAAQRKKLLLATVKGDVHDIGKNLVSMVFSGNGFEVLDLGTKVEHKTILEAAKAFQPDVIGLSGLLVRSALHMIDAIKHLDQAGIRIPVLVGGAALSQAFTDAKLSPQTSALVLYTKNAMKCLEVAKAVCAQDGEVAVRRSEALRKNASNNEVLSEMIEADRSKKTSTKSISYKDDLARQNVTNNRLKTSSISIDSTPRMETISFDVLQRLANPAMLYGHHLGLKGAHLDRMNTLTDEALAALDSRAVEVRKDVRRAIQLLREGGVVPSSLRMIVQAIRTSEGVALIHPNNGEMSSTLKFPEVNGVCLGNFVSKTIGNIGSVGIFVAQCGVGLVPLVRDLMEKGELRLAHTIQTVAISFAEAAAQWTHAQLRDDWHTAPLPAADELTEQLRNAWIRGDYPGRRASPGYSLFPDLDAQKALFDLLKPEVMGVCLTESCMMSPEASVSAVVFPNSKINP